MLTIEGCFQNPNFATWWEQVDSGVLSLKKSFYVKFDKGSMLELLIDFYEMDYSVPDAVINAIEVQEILQAEEGVVQMTHSVL
jgi:hypothetical protein